MNTKKLVTKDDTEALGAEISACIAESTALAELHKQKQKQRQAAKTQTVPEGFVLVSNDQFESLSEFKDLYKRAIINAKKRKDQVNWAHVAGLGVGSGRAVKLCKEFGIDPNATNMHAAEAQEQSHD